MAGDANEGTARPMPIAVPPWPRESEPEREGPRSTDKGGTGTSPLENPKVIGDSCGHCLVKERHGDRYWRNSFPSYPYNPLHFVNEYLGRNGHRSHPHQHYPFQKIHRDPMNRYNPTDNLDTGRGYLDTACCSTKLCFEKNNYPVCVVHTVPLVFKLLEEDHIDPCPRDSDGFCCYCSLKQHAGEAIRLSGDVLYPKKFVKLLQLILPDLEWGQHQDAHEFLRCFLDKLDKAPIAPMSPSERPSSIVKEIFGGQLRSQLHCPECNHCSDTLEPFLDLSLEVIEMDTVTEALESFTKVEVFEDFSCDKCKCRVNMEKHLKVEQAPEVLVIHLKRFQNVGSDISKIQAMVEYQLELDLNPFMSSADQEPPKYDLYGVVEHLGVSSNGHYVCYIRSSQTDWFLFDDDKVTKYSEARVLDNKAYLLFYTKQGSSLWFSKLLKLYENTMLVPDSSKEFAEKSSDKIDFSSEGKDSAGHCFNGTTEKNETGPSFVGDLSQLQVNADCGTLHDVRENGANCSLGGVLSRGTQKATCLPGPSADNGKDGGRKVLLENKENASPQGSHNMYESSQVTEAPPQEASPQKDENICSPLQSSHEHGDGCSDQMRSCSAGPVLHARGWNGTSRLRTVGLNSDHERGHLDHSVSNGDGDESNSRKRSRPLPALQGFMDEEESSLGQEALVAASNLCLLSQVMRRSVMVAGDGDESNSRKRSRPLPALQGFMDEEESSLGQEALVAASKSKRRQRK